MCRRCGGRRRPRRLGRGRRRGGFSQGSTEGAEGEPVRSRPGWSLWRDRRRLRQVSAPGVGEVGLGSGLQPRQVCSQPLKLLLLVLADFLLFLTLSDAVRRSVVVGAPFWLSTPATASLILAWLLPLLRMVLLHSFGAVALEVPVRLAAVALVGAGSGHRGPPARDYGA